MISTGNIGPRFDDIFADDGQASTPTMPYVVFDEMLIWLEKNINDGVVHDPKVFHCLVARYELNGYGCWSDSIRQRIDGVLHNADAPMLSHGFFALKNGSHKAFDLLNTALDADEAGYAAIGLAEITHCLDLDLPLPYGIDRLEKVILRLEQLSKEGSIRATRLAIAMRSKLVVSLQDSNLEKSAEVKSGLKPLLERVMNLLSDPEVRAKRPHYLMHWLQKYAVKEGKVLITPQSSSQ